MAASQKTQTEHYPDEGFLSNYRYANAFFGFSIDFPADGALREIPTAAPPDGSIPLLETIGSVPCRLVLSISAYPSADRRSDARLLLRRELDNELMIGVEELHGLSKTSIAGHQFYYFETRRGIDQHAIYATDLDGYVIRIVTAGRDPKMVQQLESAVTHMRFFPAESIAEYAGVGAHPYNGPAIPSHILAEIESDPPARKLDPGKLSGHVYENSGIGFAYELPKNWHFGTEAAVMPAVERSREHNLGQPGVGPNEQMLVKACERTLISAWRQVPAQTGEISYDGFGEVTISAMSLACFPNVKFPDLTDGKESLRDFVVTYGLSHPIVRDMRGARAFQRDGRTFIIMDGVVAYHEPGDSLSRRVSVALALTKQRDYLLSFFFSAPHDSELRELMNAKAAFDAEPAVQQPKSATVSPATAEQQLQPGGSTPSDTSLKVPSPGATAAAAGNTAPVADASVSANANQSASAAANQAAGGTSQPNSDAQNSPSVADLGPTRPSLLRPGETMQDQQMKGAPIPKQSSRK